MKRLIIITIACILSLAAPRANSELLSENNQFAELLLYGGKDNTVFLGSLNSNRFSSESICNRFGEYGSRFSSNSIWNRFGEYGSRFSPFSPWNKFASNPPVIVDRQGNSYGYFTSNRNYPNRTTIKLYLMFLNNVDWVNEDLQRARDALCE